MKKIGHPLSGTLEDTVPKSLSQLCLYFDLNQSSVA